MPDDTLPIDDGTDADLWRLECLLDDIEGVPLTQAQRQWLQGIEERIHELL